uniref:Uncharacterized protein n=1 Tax=Triticum urartu TaxID=4572 RepID=A0A8R7TRT1_TRIUA
MGDKLCHHPLILLFRPPLFSLFVRRPFSPSPFAAPEHHAARWIIRRP